MTVSPRKVPTTVRSVAPSERHDANHVALDLIIFGSRLADMKQRRGGGGGEEGRGDVRLPPPSDLSGCVEELLVADQPKWTPAPRRAPVCLRRSEQSEHAAKKWMHFLCPQLRLGSLRLSHYSYYSAACGLSNAPPPAPPLTGLCFGRGLDSFFQGHFINNPVWPVPGGVAGVAEGVRVRADAAAEFTTSEALWPLALPPNT